MAETRHREGSKALLSYNFSKEPELANSLDPGSDATGNMRYVLNGIYESPDGIADHWQQAQASWGDFGAMVKMIASCAASLRRDVGDETPYPTTRGAQICPVPRQPHLAQGSKDGELPDSPGPPDRLRCSPTPDERGAR